MQFYVFFILICFFLCIFCIFLCICYVIDQGGEEKNLLIENFVSFYCRKLKELFYVIRTYLLNLVIIVITLPRQLLTTFWEHVLLTLGFKLINLNGRNTCSHRYLVSILTLDNAILIIILYIYMCMLFWFAFESLQNFHA